MMIDHSHKYGRPGRLALSTALNTSYFAEQVGTFAIVLGVALVLTGVGFVVLTVGALWHHEAPRI